MKLLVAYDGSEGADDALTDLPSAGLPATAEATVVSVADVICLTPGGTDPEPAAGWPSGAIDLARSERLAAVEHMRSRAELAADRIRKQFPRWTVHAEAHGDSPAWGILKRADALRPDLVVLGSHGSSAIGRFFLGSVSLKVLHAAACSVRIARRRRGDPRSAPGCSSDRRLAERPRSRSRGQVAIMAVRDDGEIGFGDGPLHVDGGAVLGRADRAMG
jgi:nucleotide-binding universal stress UspA family protein